LAAPSFGLRVLRVTAPCTTGGVADVADASAAAGGDDVATLADAGTETLGLLDRFGLRGRVKLDGADLESRLRGLPPLARAARARSVTPAASVCHRAVPFPRELLLSRCYFDRSIDSRCCLREQESTVSGAFLDGRSWNRTSLLLRIREALGLLS
jgi:hypothetical protein